MSLIDKYRPKTWKDVVGHEAQVRALKNAVEKGIARTFLFTGPSGVGKTTLARIVAGEVGCLEQDLIEVDAATKTGIDDMREVQDAVQYRPLGEGTVKAVIIDEFHALSKNAVQSLLKITETPPDWVYWMFCTTEPGKVLPTIKTRSFHCDLKPVPTKDLIDLLGTVADSERLADGPNGDALLKLCAQEARGSPRQAISNLALCAAAKSLDEAELLLVSAMEEAEAIDLARLLVKGAPWKDVQNVLSRFKEGTNPESVRHVVRAYLTTVILKANNNDAAGRALEVLDCFLQPFNHHDGISPLVMACGKAAL